MSFSTHSLIHVRTRDLASCLAAGFVHHSWRACSWGGSWTRGGCKTLKFCENWDYLSWSWKFNYQYRVLSSVADPGRGPGGPPPLFLDQNEARRAGKKCFWGQPPPPLNSGSGWPSSLPLHPLIWRSGSATEVEFLTVGWRRIFILIAILLKKCASHRFLHWNLFLGIYFIS